jgi:glycosyl transferase, family 25
MKKIVISLSTAVERRKHISNEFAQKNVDFDFFDALTPEPAAVFSQELGLKIDERILTKGELACFMSHVFLWKKMVDDQIPYTAIFEDDIYLGEDVKEFLCDGQWIDPSWNLIKLEEFTHRIKLSKMVKKFDGQVQRSLFQLKSKNLGTAGYILSLEGAKKLLNYIQTLDYLVALDHLMFEHIIHDNIFSVYQMKPALCIQDVTLYSCKDSVKFASHLYKERLTRRKYNKRKGVNKFILELYRILNQVKSIIFFRTVGFK